MAKNNIRQKPEHCQNCNQQLDKEMDYCPGCGQKALHEHLTLNYFIHEFLNNLFSYDSKLLLSEKI